MKPFVPIDKSVDLKIDGREVFLNLLCRVGGWNEQTYVGSEQPTTPIFVVWVPGANHKIGKAFAKAALYLVEPTILCSRRMKVS